MDLSEIDDDELVGIYPKLLKELKKREIIRTNNLVGELGKFIVMQSFEKRPELPTLYPAANSQKNYSFRDAHGSRFGKNNPGNEHWCLSQCALDDSGEQSFEYLIVLPKL